MEVSIYVDGVERHYQVDENQIINNDWNRIIGDMYDTLCQRHDPDEPSFLEQVEKAGV